MVIPEVVLHCQSRQLPESRSYIFGMGEKLSDLEQFIRTVWRARILGMGDVLPY